VTREGGIQVVAINLTDASSYYTHPDEDLLKQHIRNVGKTNVSLDFLRDTSVDTCVRPRTNGKKKKCVVILNVKPPLRMLSSRSSHIDIACRSVCDQDQNGIKRSTFFLGADEGIKTNSKRLISTDQCTFFRYLAGMATFCPLNSRRIKRSRASEQSDQAIKVDFH